MGALLPFCDGARGPGLPGFASHGSSFIYVGAGCQYSASSWMSGALNHYLAMLLLNIINTEPPN